MRRRSFLNYSCASIPLAFDVLPRNLVSRTLLQSLAARRDDRVLVLIELNGGNDGLNTLVPLDQYDDLAALRPTILLPESRLRNLDDEHAFHPAFAAAEDLYHDGRLGIVQSVGYADQNRSHFRSLDIWRTAPAERERLDYGWLGRALDREHPAYPDDYPSRDNPHPIAISVGNTVGATCQGAGGNFALAVHNPFQQTSILEGGGGEPPNTRHGSELAYLRTSIRQANQYSSVVKERAEAGNSIAEYPNDRLGQQLSYVAQMISGGLETKVYLLSLTGFDTHGAQVLSGDPSRGRHPSLIRNLAEGIAAFQRDLHLLGLGDRVLGMTYSEFGRQIRENGGLGTDHGNAAPMFLFGDCVTPGILGDNPEIDPVASRGEGVTMQYDFRDVYGSILEDWFDLPRGQVESILVEGYNKLPIVNACNGASSNADSAPASSSLALAPNRFRSGTRLSFESVSRAPIHLTAYTVYGARIETLFSGRLPRGEHSVGVDVEGYPTGTIVFHLQQGARVEVARGIKL